MTIKYRYALDSNQRVVDIVDLTESDRKDYECIACGQVLRPVLGKIRRKHFRHKVDTGCSGETYLHRVGKLLFQQVYRQCLDSGVPFEVELLRPRLCTLCQKYGPCEISIDPARYDLTKFFPTLALETPDDRFIPDLLLLNDNGEKIYVEIAVTHLSTVEKRSSDNRIIELTVEEESDLEIIKTCRLPETDDRIEFVHFNIEPVEGNFSDQCNQILPVFYLWHTGKSIISYPTVAAFRQYYYDKTKQFFFSIVSSGNSSRYFEALERAYLRGLKVKNCYLCRYHGFPNYHQRMKSSKPVFCKFMKKLCRSNDAAECEYYRPDQSTFWIHQDGKIEDLSPETAAFRPSIGMRLHRHIKENETK